MQTSLFPLFFEVQILWEESEPTRCQAPYRHQTAQGHRFESPCCWSIPPISTFSSSFLPSIQPDNFDTCGYNVFCSTSHSHTYKTSDQNTKHLKNQSHSYFCPLSYMRCDSEISVFDGQNCPFASMKSEWLTAEVWEWQGRLSCSCWRNFEKFDSSSFQLVKNNMKITFTPRHLKEGNKNDCSNDFPIWNSLKNIYRNIQKPFKYWSSEDRCSKTFLNWIWLSIMQQE